jgi:methylase of polypeptide subunit release factors
MGQTTQAFPLHAQPAGGASPAPLKSGEGFLHSWQKSFPVRMIRRGVHAVVYNAFVKPAITRTDVTSMLGFSLTIPPSVFHPKFYLTSRFFAKYLRTQDLHDLDILEMGCGSGILSLVAARNGARVTSADINPKAVECTLFNAKVNGLEDRVRGYTSDLFAGLPDYTAFHHIIWSPPFYPRDPVDDAERAWYAGEGYSVIARFAGTARMYLRTGGSIILLVSSEIDIPRILSFFESAGFAPALLRTRKKLFETLSIYEFR